MSDRNMSRPVEFMVEVDAEAPLDITCESLQSQGFHIERVYDRFKMIGVTGQLSDVPQALELPGILSISPTNANIQLPPMSDDVPQ